MLDFSPSIVITTFNRTNLLPRAIQSVLDQDWPGVEVLVVDDCSTDGTADLMRTFSQVRYLKQDTNRGLCAARNRGIREARNPWVIFLDDDDTFLPQSLSCIAHRLSEMSHLERYPMFQFARTNGRATKPFSVVTLDDYLTGSVSGDFAAVIRRDLFLSEELSFPEIHLAEGILWWRVAQQYGIPTWTDPVQMLHDDAATRMCSTTFLMRKSREHARVHEEILQEFGAFLLAHYPAAYYTRLLGAATYRLLAQERSDARKHLRAALQQKVTIPALGLWVLSMLPIGLTRTAYSTYKRQRDSGWKS